MTVRDPKDLPQLPEAPERRDFLKGAAVGGVVAAASLQVAQGVVTEAKAQAPAVQPWWPSRFGADDQVGATHLITPQKVMEAAQWIRDGKIYRIGRVSESQMPKFGDRAFTLRIPGNPTGGPFAANKVVYNDEYLATEIGQTGTQFDGLAHIGLQLGKDGDTSEMAYYNGVRGSDMVGSTGMKKLGIENVKPIFTRGHLIDVMAQRGGMLDVGQEVTLADVRGALAKQSMNEGDIKPGDALFFNTGWGSLWMRNNDRYGSGEPGPGLEVARWAAEKQIVVMGADNWAVEAVPNPDRNLAFPVHVELLAKNGIHIHENLQFDALIADRKYQFVYIFSPIPIKGATGSPGGPIAVT